LQKMSIDFDSDIYEEFMRLSKVLITKGLLKQNLGNIIVAENSKFLTDHIISELMIV